MPALMPGTARRDPGGVVFHVLNRAVGRRRLIHKERGYFAFERAMHDALEQVPMRLLAYCLMPNHWHLLLWPHADGQLRRFMQRLTTIHVRRWQSHYHVIAAGQMDSELECLRPSIRKGRPFGQTHWQHQTSERLGLRSCFRERGGPRVVRPEGALS